MAEILEIIMIVSFGASWPMNVMKSYKARTAKGKSVAFLCLILFGYVRAYIWQIFGRSNYYWNNTCCFGNYFHRKCMSSF